MTHYSDSGFSSTLSSGSSCSFLPPPPPYRGFRGSTKQQHRIHRSLSDSKYGSTTECHLMRLPTGLCAGSVNLQELCRAPRAGSWTSRVSSLFHLPSVISPRAFVHQFKVIYSDSNFFFCLKMHLLIYYLFSTTFVYYTSIALLLIQLSSLLFHYGKSK